MKDNVTAQTFTLETETIDDVNYTPFIFTERYMKWTKIDNNTAVASTSFEQGSAPVFVRLHVYSDPSSYPDSDPNYTTSNTLGANKAYMLIRSGNVPKALWNTTGGGGVKRFIGIEGVSDIYDWSDESDGNSEGDENPGNGKTGPIYNLSGQMMGDDESVLTPGIYIRNGKKFVVR